VARGARRRARGRGPDRAHFLIEALIDRARRSGAYLPFSANTAYINTIPVEKQVRLPGDFNIEQKIRHYVRWNAMAMVVRANKDTNVGGHIASFASAAMLYDIGYNHFWHAPVADHGGDLVFVQGHSAPASTRARSCWAGSRPSRWTTSGRKSTARASRRTRIRGSCPISGSFRRCRWARAADGDLSGALHEVLAGPRLAQTEGRKVWAFMGDGEMDEPESMGAIGMAARENLDNLIFVVNCNLQRLDGPVRGNGKIIQELESDFRGSGWNVIKIVWGRHWDPLFARDKQGILMRRMMECVDGEYQTFKSKDGAYVREHFFNTPS
jgi:pyruvate dehydrogenase E1 component